MEDTSESSDDETYKPEIYVNWMHKVQANPAHPRFFGKSSGLMLIRPAIESRHAADGSKPSTTSNSRLVFTKRLEYSRPRPVCIRSLMPSLWRNANGRSSGNCARRRTRSTSLVIRISWRASCLISLKTIYEKAWSTFTSPESTRTTRFCIARPSSWRCGTGYTYAN